MARLFFFSEIFLCLLWQNLFCIARNKAESDSDPARPCLCAIIECRDPIYLWIGGPIGSFCSVMTGQLGAISALRAV